MHDQSIAPAAKGPPTAPQVIRVMAGPKASSVLLLMLATATAAAAVSVAVEHSLDGGKTFVSAGEIALHAGVGICLLLQCLYL